MGKRLMRLEKDPAQQENPPASLIKSGIFYAVLKHEFPIYFLQGYLSDITIPSFYSCYDDTVEWRLKLSFNNSETPFNNYISANLKLNQAEPCEVITLCKFFVSNKHGEKLMEDKTIQLIYDKEHTKWAMFKFINKEQLRKKLTYDDIEYDVINIDCNIYYFKNDNIDMAEQEISANFCSLITGDDDLLGCV
uniref:MATH domain-containing protein n=1 Tax=Strongyloides venezuelensis TaxID=75913 RepID=A0A0K0FRK6_STRVS